MSVVTGRLLNHQLLKRVRDAERHVESSRGRREVTGRIKKPRARRPFLLSRAEHIAQYIIESRRLVVVQILVHHSRWCGVGVWRVRALYNNNKPTAAGNYRPVVQSDITPTTSHPSCLRKRNEYSNKTLFMYQNKYISNVFQIYSATGLCPCGRDE